LKVRRFQPRDAAAVVRGPPSLAWLAAEARIADNPRPVEAPESHGPIHLYDEPRRQGRAAEAPHPPRHLLSFFPGAKIGVLGLNGSGNRRCCASWRAPTRISRAEPAAAGIKVACCRRNRSWTRRPTCAASSKSR
jgi:hypothetical protein